MSILNQKNLLPTVSFLMMLFAIKPFFIAEVYGESESSIFPLGSHCTAYRVNKKMFFVATVEVIGRNCEINARFVSSNTGQVSIEVFIPAIGFRSGSEKRDKHVAEMVGSPGHPNLIFHSSALSPETWRKALKKGSLQLTGFLRIKGKKHLIETSVRFMRNKNGWEADGVIKTKFSKFNMKPPRVGPGGLIADTKDLLELHFHLLSARIAGLELILKDGQ